jgi:hypothetical protein
MNSIFDIHFKDLVELHPRASIDLRPDGSRLVSVPNYALPRGGWNASATTIYFIVMSSYPQAKPDCFWTDPELRLANGGTPKNSSINKNHGGAQNLQWFSWHASTWNPNKDSLLTYLRVIDRRLREFQ